MSVIATETVVVLSGGDDAAARLRLEDFALLLCDQATKHGCRAVATWDGRDLKVRMQEDCAKSLQYVFQWLGETAAEQGAQVEIGADQEAGPRIRGLTDGAIPWGTVVHARLTRELLCALPERAYVVCNATPGEVAVALGRLGPFVTRAQQWQKARAAGLDGTMCRVFWSEEDFAAFVDEAYSGSDGALRDSSHVASLL